MKHKTQTEMKSLLLKYEQYSGTKKSFCAEQGIRQHTLYYWQRKLSEQASSKSNNKFIALQVERSSSLGQIEVAYPNGNRVLLPPDCSFPLIERLLQISC